MEARFEYECRSYQIVVDREDKLTQAWTDGELAFEVRGCVEDLEMMERIVSAFEQGIGTGAVRGLRRRAGFDLRASGELLFP